MFVLVLGFSVEGGIIKGRKEKNSKLFRKNVKARNSLCGKNII